MSISARLASALSRGVASQLQPSMLALLAVPFVVGVVGWLLAAWLLWDPLTHWLQVSVFDSSAAVRWVMQWLPKDSGSIAVGAVIALLLLIPMVFATAVALIAVFAMPVVTHHLSQGMYRSVGKQGSWSVMASSWNALTSLLLFLVGYLLTMPLWLIPPLALVVPWFWWSWLTSRMMRFDSLVEHATPAERSLLIGRHRREYLMLGLAVTALNYVPPLFLITPVLSALVFGHYSLSRLAELRGLPVAGPPVARVGNDRPAALH